MKKLFILVFILTVVDAICTAVGVHLGCVEEANPFFQSMIMSHPVLAASAVCAGVGAVLYGMYLVRNKVRFMAPLIIGLLIIKLAVVGMHIGWMAQII
jgi:hypothetical protein